jgi:hypothetical protein
MLLNVFECGEPMVNGELPKTAREKHNREMTQGRVQSFIYRHFNALDD